MKKATKKEVKVMFWIGFLAAIGLVLAIYGIVKGIETLIADAVKEECENMEAQITNYIVYSKCKDCKYYQMHRDE